MAQTQGQVIANNLKWVLVYAERLLNQITAENFARYASPGGIPIISNHPAFVFGHLSIYGPRIVEQLGGDASSLTATEHYMTLFSFTATCQDDPDGTIYPSMEEIVDKFRKGSLAAIAALEAADDATLQQPNPIERMLDRFPTLGSAHAFYAGPHAAVHLGQISAWRRMMGMGNA